MGSAIRVREAGPVVTQNTKRGTRAAAAQRSTRAAAAPQSHQAHPLSRALFHAGSSFHFYLSRQGAIYSRAPKIERLIFTRFMRMYYRGACLPVGSTSKSLLTGCLCSEPA